jgi:hypothetical protein
MNRRSVRSIGFTASATALGVLTMITAERAANAAPPVCSSLPNVLTVESGDTQEPLLKSLGAKMVVSAAMPITLVYNTTGSCTLVNDITTGTKLTVALKYIPLPNDPNAVGWDPTKPSPTCTTDVGGNAIDVAISALFVSSCTQTPLPAGLGAIEGPVQAYTWVVPKASAQKSTTAEEMYFTFGFGNVGQVTPWNDETFMSIRPVTKSTLLTLAAAINVPAAKWKGTPFDKSTDLLNAVANAASADKAIGILGGEISDANRDKVTVLAYQAYKQKHGYWPDSTSTSFDKRNLRDGHYLPWSPTVYLTAVDAQSVPTNAKAKYMIDLVLGNPTTPPFESEGLDVVVAKGLIPDCAMKVKRGFDGGDLSLYSPPAACGCYYESKVPQGAAPASCTACSTTTPCATGTCRHGYCEVP